MKAFIFIFCIKNLNKGLLKVISWGRWLIGSKIQYLMYWYISKMKAIVPTVNNPSFEIFLLLTITIWYCIMSIHYVSQAFWSLHLILDQKLVSFKKYHLNISLKRQADPYLVFNTLFKLDNFSTCIQNLVSDIKNLRVP